MFAKLKWRTPKEAQLRHCAKVAIAAIAAYALTLGERHEHALFSMLSAALVVGGSVGENLNTSLNRVRGTLAGALVGVAVAYALGMSIWSLGIGVAALAWLCAGLGWGLAATRVGIAMLLVVLFTHTGDAVEYGGWRMLNTVVGVCVGIAVNRWVWPIRGHHEIEEAVNQALAASTATLAALVRGVAPNVLLPLQVQVLDALAAIRAARKNAQLERELEQDTDLLNTQVLLVARAAIATLGVSTKLDELTQAQVRAEALDAVRQAIAPLVAQAEDTTSAAPAPDEFTARHAQALQATAHLDLDADTRHLLTGVLSELRQISTALEAMRAARGQKAGG